MWAWRARLQNPSSRLKRSLIAHEAEFVALQRLDEKRQETVPASEPGETQNITILAPEGYDSVSGYLSVRLSELPSGDWQEWFRDPRGHQRAGAMVPQQCIFTIIATVGGVCAVARGG